MNATRHVIGFVVKDILRSRWSIMNMVFYAATTSGLFYLQADGTKVAISLASLSLVFVPLVSLLFTSMYFYNSRSFVELILTQPVSRRTVFVGLYAGIIVSLVVGLVVGVFVPYAVFGSFNSTDVGALTAVMVIGVSLSAVFVGLAFLTSIRFDDRGKGLAVVLGVWLVAAIVYDGLLLAAATAFSHYPLETPLLAASLANPVDLARVVFLIHSDMAALMGYTGAVFVRFFDQTAGLAVAAASMLVWAVAPLLFGLRRFSAKDF